MVAQAELGTRSGWSSTPTSSVVLGSLGSLLMLLVILVAGYKVSRQRVVNLHQDQSQSVRKDSTENHQKLRGNFLFPKTFQTFQSDELKSFSELKKIFSRLPFPPCAPPLRAALPLPTPLTTSLTTVSTTPRPRSTTSNTNWTVDNVSYLESLLV